MTPTPIQHGIKLLLFAEAERPPIHADWKWQSYNWSIAMAVAPDGTRFFCEVTPGKFILRRATEAAEEDVKRTAGALKAGTVFIEGEYAEYQRVKK